MRNTRVHFDATLKFGLGVILGVISKVLDEIPSNSLSPLLETFDLGNFFYCMEIGIFLTLYYFYYWIFSQKLYDDLDYIDDYFSIFGLCDTICEMWGTNFNRYFFNYYSGTIPSSFCFWLLVFWFIKYLRIITFVCYFVCPLSVA